MNELQLKDAITRFKEGEIGVFPTDTAYGIGCRMDNPESVKKIFKIRNRVETKPLLILTSDMEMVERYTYPSAKVKQFANKYWPGGVTLILPCRTNLVPDIVRARGSTLAVRIPNHRELLDIIQEVGVPIVAPSANISGKKTPYSLDEVDGDLLESADFVLSGECTYKKESTIVDTMHEPWEIIRQGAIEIKDL